MLLFGVQVVVVQALVPSPVADVHADTPVGPVRTFGQVVAVQLLILVASQILPGAMVLSSLAADTG